MERRAFKMFLNPGASEDHRRRHDARSVAAGVRNYSIHLDPETNILFADLERRRDHAMDAPPESPVMRKWWEHMKDIMRANPDGSPVTAPLREMFHFD